MKCSSIFHRTESLPSIIQAFTDDIPKPVPKENEEALIRVLAAALNPIDKIRVEGGIKAIRPETLNKSILGYDAAGIVEVGAGKFSVGDDMYVRVPASGNPFELVHLQSTSLQKLPMALKSKSISFEEAASLPLAGVTALQVLRKGNVSKGDKA